MNPWRSFYESLGVSRTWFCSGIWDVECGVWLPVLSISYELIGIVPGISHPSHLTPSLICEKYIYDIGKVQFHCSVVSNSLQPHGLLHARPPCPSPTPGVYPNSCPLSRWCHPTISSSVIPFSSHLQSFPASGSFPVSQLFTSGGQSIGVSASTSVLSMNTQDWSPLGWTGWISLQSKGLSRVFSNTTVQKLNSSVLSFLFSPTLTSIHDYWKNHSLD